MRLVVRARAQADLASILDHGVVDHGEAVAEAYLRRIATAFDRLIDHPDIGIDESDRAPRLRSYAVGEHRIYYLRLDDRLSVVRVLHKAMDAPRHL